MSVKILNKTILDDILLLVDFESSYCEYLGTGQYQDITNVQPLYNTSATDTKEKNYIRINGTFLSFENNTDFNYLQTGSFSVTIGYSPEALTYPYSYLAFFVNNYVRNDTLNTGWGINLHPSTTPTYIRVAVCDGSVVNYTTLTATMPPISGSYVATVTVDRSNGCKTRIYVNNEYLGEHNATNVTGSIYEGNRLRIGDQWGWKNYGKIFFVAVHKRVLTEYEIRKLYNMLKGRLWV